jgi:predicted aspartyl protease
MGRTLVTATINGPKATKEYSFLVDTGSSYVGLPMVEIRELGLTSIPNGKMQFVTAAGVVELDTYTALGQIDGQGFSATVIPAPVPLVGYELLENRRFRVNPVTQRIERVPPDEIAPPYLLPILDHEVSWPASPPQVGRIE